MKKINYFKTRIVRDNIVFLLAEDVAGVLGARNGRLTKVETNMLD